MRELKRKAPAEFVCSILGREAKLIHRPRLERPEAGLVFQVPHTLQERPINERLLPAYDKGFACEWLDGRTVVIGTKDDKVVFIDAASMRIQKVVHIPLSETRPPRMPEAYIMKNCGIRSLAVSPSGDLIAAPGCGPNDCAIISLPSREPVQMLESHKDWVFGAAWVSDMHLVTGSKDKTLKLWQARHDGSSDFVSSPSPLFTRRYHNGKVRDVKWCQNLQMLASLSTDGHVGFWTSSLDNIREVELGVENELCCMTNDDTLFACGSLEHVHVIDPRQEKPITAVTAIDARHGVRSLQLRDGLLSIGTGRGHILFYDLRAGKYMPCENGSGRLNLTLGKGWLSHNQAYMNYFLGTDVHNAAMAHAWDPGGNRLFVTGGPLAAGLQGSYMALWS